MTRGRKEAREALRTVQDAILEVETGINALRLLVSHLSPTDDMIEQDRRNNAIEWIGNRLATQLDAIGSYAEQEARGVQGDLS